jgi:hypothetical protein
VKEQAAADAAAARTEAEDRARTHKKRMLALMQRCQELEQVNASASATVSSSSTISTAAAYTAGGPISRRASAAVQNLCKPASQLPDPAARNAAAPGWMSHNFD